MEKKKRYIIKRTRKRTYFLFYIYLLVILMSLSTVASYTWFTISRTPKVSNMNMYITSASGLELSADPGAEIWRTNLDFWETEELAQYRDVAPENRPFLRQITWSDAEQKFFAPVYGYDGRLINFIDEYPDEYAYFISWYPLEDQSHANKATLLEGYYMKSTFYARCGQNTQVCLSEPKVRDDAGTQGSGTYLVGYPSNTGRGPEVAVRVGFRMTYVDKAGNELSERSPMYIYEPNSDRHVDGSTGYNPTYSIDNEGTLAETTPVETDRLLVSEDRLITQKFSTSGTNPGEFLNNPTLFSLEPGQIVRIEMYLWLEGQDVDCSNIMSVQDDNPAITQAEERNYRELRANIQFAGPDDNDYSGMVPIE